MTTEMAATLDWYFDLVSPFSYLQLQNFAELPGHLTIVPKPIVFGAVLKHWGQLGPAEITPKRIYTYRHCQWIADRRGVPFRMPPRHPFNSLKALRLLAGLGPDLAAVHTAFDFIFAEGRGPDDPGELAELGRRLGLDGDAEAHAADQEAKDRLRGFTDEAIARGIFGVPSFHVAGQNFWGDDATGFLLDFLANPKLFETGEMRRIETLPVGVTRERAGA